VNEGATSRALALLRDDVARMASRNGYIDLLSDAELPSTGLVQDLMRLGVVSDVYERWWRPALGRLAKGVFGPGMADEHRIARLFLELAPGDRVLDVACGPGNFSRSFARAVGDSGLVVGIDASRPMLERAVRDSAGIESNLVFVHGDAVELPFRDSSFDAVCCFAALHLFSDPRAALDRMRAALRPGGRIALFTSCRGRSVPVRAFESLIAWRSGMRMFEQHEITEELASRGFDDIRQRISGFTQFVGARLPSEPAPRGGGL